MVLDMSCFRKSDDPAAIGPDQVRQGQKDRYKDVKLVDVVIENDEKWRTCTFKKDTHNQLNNVFSNVVKEKMKAKNPGDPGAEVPEGTLEKFVERSLAGEKKDALIADLVAFSVAQLKTLVKVNKQAQVTNDAAVAESLSARESARRQIGNLLHESVPIAKDEKDDVMHHIHGDVTSTKTYSHFDLIHMIGGVDYKRGVMVSGDRAYFLKGTGVALEQALVAYAHAFLVGRNMEVLSPPLFMNKEVMGEVAQLNQFDDELYKVTGKSSEIEGDTSTTDKYLIATAEQPIAAFHRGDRLEESELPKRYAGISECFRQEVGSHGRDTKGIFRVHQFKKIEQFALCTPETSWQVFEEMIKNAEDFTQSLGLSYRVQNIASGDLNLAAAKKFDLEAWFPAGQAFRELVSCSNCTDYQARRLDIKIGKTKKMNEDAKFVHMLNSTLCATTRMVCCILENFQFGEYPNGGVVIPEVLRPYMPAKYQENPILPFVNDRLPTDEEIVAAKAANKGNKKAKGGGKKGGKK